ncbi:MAG: oxidoreductase [Bacteroidetes bacterium]|nr:oxidoreductase [Bacteroidota bacterium]
MLKLYFTLLILIAPAKWLLSQQPSIEIIEKGQKTNLRGLSVVNNNVVWVSGSNGIVGKSVNAGKNWKWFKVAGFEKTDFRDIEGFDSNTAVIMGVGEPAYILKTIDGGDTWKVVYENKSKGMFLDAMEFWNEQAGIVIGDPIDNRFFITRTFDGGSTWQDIPFSKRPIADSGEACFAASGTNIRALDRDEAVFVSGGMKSSMYKRNEIIELSNMIQGSETTGANSIAVWDNHKKNGGKKIIIVGGDFKNDTVSNKNCIYSNDGGKTWHTPNTPPHGYRSCVEFISEKDLITCGLTGVDYSANGCNSWTLISSEGFNTCRIAKTGKAIFLTGNNGKIGKIVWK